MKQRKYDYYVADFETSVFPGQTSTEVWAAALVPLWSEDVKIDNNIDDFLKYIVHLKGNQIVYFHNLKFDGSFLLDFFLRVKQYKQARTEGKNITDFHFVDDKDMKNGEFKYVISNMGQWYSVTLKIKNKFIEFRDSLKLLPFSVEQIGKGFKTKHRKSSIEYIGERHAGGIIKEHEKVYIANDVLVVKEGLEILFSDGHNKMTIGACCLSEFKSTFFEKKDYDRLFPDLTKFRINEKYEAANADEYIRKSYHGGWCYVVKGKENKIFTNGITADVNSLYPSVMHSASGNYYPVGLPRFYSGKEFENHLRLCNDKTKYFYFIRIRTRFYIKKNMLPCIQIKGNYFYKPEEWLETSDIFDYKTNSYYDKYYDLDGNLQKAKVTLTLTCTDYELIKKHYNLVDCEILDGCIFSAEIGIFDKYINKWKEIKENAPTAAIKQESKLFLNNLYGKLSASDDSSFKVANLVNNQIKFFTVPAHEKKPGFIAVGSAITSYARNFTISAAQKNYYGKDKPGFIYADTDSIHCDISADKLKDIPVHKTSFNHWKLEASWDKAIFVRQKTYIEHITAENLEKIENPYYCIKCAGMPKRCKDFFEKSIAQPWKENAFPWLEYLENLNDDEYEFVMQKRELNDFAINLVVPGKLMPMRIPGGIVLADTTFYFHEVKRRSYEDYIDFCNATDWENY